MSFVRVGQNLGTVDIEGGNCGRGTPKGFDEGPKFGGRTEREGFEES